MSTDESSEETNEIKTISRVYADVVSEKSKTFFKYKRCTAKMDEIDNYDLIKQIGEGRYSTVFEGFNKSAKKNVIIKILKPTKKIQINRETTILKHLKDADNIVKFNCMIKFPEQNSTALVFEKLPNYTNLKSIICNLNEYEIRFYTYQLLRALDYCHSQGVMHRDLKPSNVVVDRNNKRLELIDFGLADFYRPGQKNNAGVGSLNFKGPELLVEFEYYDYSVDLWALGCTFASMIFHRSPFFDGKDEESQLICIVQVLDLEEFRDYLNKYLIKLPPDSSVLTAEYEQMSWASFITTENQNFVNDDALDLLNGFLKFDHIDRITAKEGMKHKYFDAITKPGTSLDEN